MIKLGIIGKPNAGKSTFFNFLTNSEAQTGDYPFTTINPNKAIFRLKSRELNSIIETVKFPDVQCPEVEVWDIAGLITGASEGAGMGNEFLGNILNCDVLIHLVKDSEHVLSDTSEVDYEMALFDHNNLLKPYEKGRRMAKLYPKDSYWVKKDKITTKAYKETATGKNILEVLTAEELDYLKGIPLISDKPRFRLINTSTKVKKNKSYINALELSAISSLAADELAQLGLNKDNFGEVAVNISELILDTLRMKRFYTIGHLGIKMYAIPLGATITDCAELLHSEKEGHIRGARITDYNNLIKYKSWKNIISSGAAHRVGSSYVPGHDQLLHYI